MVDIYIIINLVNGKEYVGITKNGYLNRFKEHIKTSKKDKCKRGSYILYKAMRKHGVENFKVELLEQVDTFQEAKIKEQEYISIFRSYYKDDFSWGYNMTKGGDGRGVSYITEKQRNKLRNISLELHKNKEYRNKYLNAMRSENHRKAVSLANSGSNNGMYKRGYLISGERNYWYGKFKEKSANFGNKYSEESKDKIRKNTKYHWENNEGFRLNNLKHLKSLGKKQIGLNHPTSKRTFLYDIEMNLIGQYTMKEIYEILECSPQTARKYRDSDIIYKGYYIYSNQKKD